MPRNGVPPATPAEAPAPAPRPRARRMTRPNVYLIRMAGVPGRRDRRGGRCCRRVLMGAFANNPLLNSLILAGAAARHRLEPAPGAAAVARGHLAGDLPDARARGWPPCPRRSCWRRWPACWRRARRRAATDQARFTLSAPAMRSLLDGIASRLDESRELSRYMTGLLIFLGLLGTFWGLLKTVGSVSDVIGSHVGGLGRHQRAVRAAQVRPGASRSRGMGTAFSASMFGLAGALVLGFLDLTAGQAQNRFYQRAGGMAGRADPAVLGRAGARATARCRSMCRRCWSRPRRTWRSCSAS